MASDSAKRPSTMPAKKMPTTTATTTPAAVAAAVAPLANVANGMSRLTPARDLTLGGRGAAAAASKKVFAPNLNAVRNKNTNVKTSKDFTQLRGGRRGARGAAGANRGARGTGNGNSSLIQTTGVFSEGAGAVHLRKSTGGGSAYARAGEEVAVARKRTERKDEKSQELRVRELIGSDASDAEEEDEADEARSDPEVVELDKTDLDCKPVRLTEGLWSNTKKHIVKKEPGTTTNVKSVDADSSDVVQQLHSLQMAVEAGLEEPPPQYGRYPRSIGAFLEVPQAQLFIMQLPNVLPCVADESNPTVPCPHPLAVVQPNSVCSPSWRRVKLGRFYAIDRDALNCCWARHASIWTWASIRASCRS
ncbi:uncharacterized protein LOC6558313 isoform X2 [Drosophila grimshawi]|uniref:uncharacterized protein LOC6558313 isoform X2 n=1 Tax=Drosophila grimshawi TaxID=7222 RepID=UPI000C86FEEE|nr:uncharacterized protein LOC6558313 isoform X2 [Drosophila grimshawi]